MDQTDTHKNIERMPLSLLKSLVAVTFIYIFLAIFLNFVVNDYLVLKFHANLVIWNLVLLVVMATYGSLFFISWTIAEYKATKGTLIVSSGLFKKIKKEYQVDNNLTLDQSLMQKMFNLGTLIYMNDKSKHTIHIRDVKNPSTIIELLAGPIGETFTTTEEIIDTNDQITSSEKSNVTEILEQLVKEQNESEELETEYVEEINEVINDYEEYTNKTDTFFSERLIEIEIETTSSTDSITYFADEEESLGEFELDKNSKA